MNTIQRSPLLAYGWLFGLAASLIFTAAHMAAAQETPAEAPAVGLETPATPPATTAEPGLETPIAPQADAATPAWVHSASEREGDALLVTVNAGPYSTPEECRQALPEAIRSAAVRYIDDFLGEVGAADRMNLSDSFLDGLRVIEPNGGSRREHLESMSLSVGTMFTLHTQLRFDRRFGDEIQARWRDTIAGNRLKLAGFAVLGGLALLGLFHSAVRWLAS